MNSGRTDYPWHTEQAPFHASYVLPAILAILAALPRGARILDAGCGNGFLAGHLAARGYGVVGVDPSAAAIGIAREAHPSLRFEHMAFRGEVLRTLEELPFDAVVSTEVIEHVTDPHAYLAASRSSLRPGGFFVCSTPYHGYAKNLALALTNRFDEHWDPLNAHGHIKFWSRRTLTQVLLNAGFEVIGVRGVGRLPWIWKSMVVTARPILDFA